MQKKSDKHSNDKGGEQEPKRINPERPEKLDKEHGEEVPAPEERKSAP
jgi:hypothetical protein